MYRILMVLLFALIAGLPIAAHARVVVGFGFGYAPVPYYYPPPVYYYPPPVVYAPPPVYYAPAPAPQSGAAPNCREYRGDAVIDGDNQPFYGTACLEADGKWHIR